MYSTSLRIPPTFQTYIVLHRKIVSAQVQVTTAGRTYTRQHKLARIDRQGAKFQVIEILLMRRVSIH